MDTVQEDTHVVLVMTNLHKETCAVVRDKDDNLLLQQTQRPRLTKEEENPQNIRQQRGMLFRQKERNSVPSQNFENPSCKFWHPPVKTTSLILDANLEEHISSGMLTLRKSPTRSKRKVVRKDQLHD